MEGLHGGLFVECANAALILRPLAWRNLGDYRPRRGVGAPTQKELVYIPKRRGVEKQILFSATIADIEVRCEDPRPWPLIPTMWTL